MDDGWNDRIAGVLLGTAVGDAIGLPREGLSRRRAERMFGGVPLRHRLIFGRGMCSDDTEHTCLVAQALIATSDVEEFRSNLAWRLRWWLLAIPAGVGKATATAIVRLWCGFGVDRCGVRSAGNGPAMRAAILGVFFADDEPRLLDYVLASSRLTHKDPRAEQGALAVALAAASARRQTADSFNPSLVWDSIAQHVSEPELVAAFQQVRDALSANVPLAELADSLGLSRGVSGFVCHTVPMALACWLNSPTDFRQAVEQVVALGGDTDTTAAVVGALAGACVGPSGIPAVWLEGLVDWPLSVRFLRRLAAQLASRRNVKPFDTKLKSPRLFWPATLLRNAVFLCIVLTHGFRRLLPPY